MALADNDGQDQVDTTLTPTGEQADSATLQTDSQGGETGETADDETVVVTIGEEAPPPDEDEALDGPGLVNKLRRINREKERELRELRAKAATPAADQQVAAVGVKPTLMDCDYDEEVFESKLVEWREKKARAEAEQQKKADDEEKAKQAWQVTVEAYSTAKKALKVENFDDAEAAVKEAFSDTQRAVLLDAVESADAQAKLVYALGNNPAELKRLALITNPVKFAIAAADLEKKLKVTPRKAAPPPEKRVSGNAAAGGSVDTKLASLEADAERTGDRSKVIAYKREQRRKQA